MVEVNFEFKTNDPWSNSVNAMTLCYYRSHINFQPIFNKQRLMYYLLKYLTKVENSSKF